MKLKEVRRLKMYSMRDLASAAGVGLSTLRHIERGTAKPRLRTVRKLVKVLEVDPLEVDEFKAAIQDEES